MARARGYQIPGHGGPATEPPFLHPTKKVTYRRDLLEVENLIDDTSKELLRIAWHRSSTKCRCWSYEQEVRVFTLQKEMDEETGMYFVDFGENLRLKEVIAGVKFTMSKRPIEEALKGYPEDVKIVKTVRSAKGFGIILDEHGFDSKISILEK